MLEGSRERLTDHQYSFVYSFLLQQGFRENFEDPSLHTVNKLSQCLVQFLLIFTTYIQCVCVYVCARLTVSLSVCLSVCHGICVEFRGEILRFGSLLSPCVFMGLNLAYQAWWLGATSLALIWFLTIRWLPLSYEAVHIMHLL